jgi:DNA-binding CsgD family transcriptional regulator
VTALSHGIRRENPADGKPAGGVPAGGKPVGGMPAGSRPGVSKPVGSRPVDGRSVGTATHGAATHAAGTHGAAARGAAARGPAVNGRAPAASQGIALGPGDLRGILRIVEDCERAPTLPVFRRTALEGLSRHLGYRHGALFLGSSVERAFQEPNPTGHGMTLRVADAFLERFRSLEAFTDPDGQALLRERGLLSLEDFVVPGRPEIRLRLERLLKAHGIHATLLVRLVTPTTIGAFIVLLDPRPGAFGPRDRAICAVLARHLGNLLRFHVHAVAAPVVTTKLSARERDVVRLVAEGCSNRQVAEALCISVDTVKHHLTHALVATGCTNRTQVALAWQREVGAAPAVTQRSLVTPTRDAR